MIKIRWRLNDPAEENTQRWTLVHVLHPGTAATASGQFGVLIPSDDEVTLCGMTVPQHAYMEDRDEQIPQGCMTCFRCSRRAARMKLS